MKRTCLLLLIAAAAALTPVFAQDADETAWTLKNRYESLSSMRARFVHTMTSDFLETRDRYSGTLVFEGDRYRVETSSQTIVTDGVTTWVFNRSEDQVLVNDYVEDESAFSLTELLQSFDDEYEPVGVETDGDRRILELAPGEGLPDYRSVRMWIRQADGLVTRMRLVDLNDAVLEFELSEIVVNPRIEPDTFQFSAPEGVEVVDLRN